MPETAPAVLQTTNLGRIERRAGEDPRPIMTRELAAAACEDGLLILTTSLETIYAPLSCDSFWDADTTALFARRQVAIALEASETRFRIFIETLEGAQAEFTVGGVWIAQA